MRFHFACNKIADDNAARFSINHNKIKHFRSRIHFYFAQSDLSAKGLISTEQQLLSGLSSRIKSSRNLSASKRTIRKQTTVFTRKRYTLGNALIYDVDADLGKPVNVGFTRTVVTALYSVIKQSVNAVA